VFDLTLYALVQHEASGALAPSTLQFFEYGLIACF
jgi:hypothetical protein